jgi:hypothetical protein
MQFSTTFLTTLLLTVTSVAGVAVPVAVPDPSPVAAAVAGPVEVPDSSLRFNAIVPRQSQPAGPSPTGACQFGSYKCSGKSIVSVQSII